MSHKESFCIPSRCHVLIAMVHEPWCTNQIAAFCCVQGESGSQVNLVIPWLAPADQAKVFPNNMSFATPAEQEKYVRDWAAKRTGFDCNFKVGAMLAWLLERQQSIAPRHAATRRVLLITSALPATCHRLHLSSAWSASDCCWL